MKSIKSPIIISIIITLLLSCTGNEKSGLGNLTYKETQTGRTIDDCDTSKDCTSIYYYYPVFDNEKQNPKIDSLNIFVMDKLLVDEIDLNSAATLDTVVNNFISDYEEQVREFPDYTIPWYSKTNASVLYQNKRYLTLKIRNESFTGGAHPNSYNNYYVISKSTGRELTLADIFEKGFEKKLNSIVAAEFRKARGITSNNSLNEEGFWFEDNQNIYNNNFGLTEKGILFYYNSYEVAPYSYGPTLIEIPYSKLQEISRI